MAAIKHILEKLWKKLYQVAINFSKENSLIYIDNEHQQIFNILNELKTAVRTTIEAMRTNLLRSRPTVPTVVLLEEYLKRIELASEILLNLNYLMKLVFDAYIMFINRYWGKNEDLESVVKYRAVSERYDMSMAHGQSILSKIQRFIEIV